MSFFQKSSYIPKGSDIPEDLEYVYEWVSVIFQLTKLNQEIVLFLGLSME